MYNSFPELTSKYRMGVSRVLSLLNSDIFDITPTLYIYLYRCAGLLTLYQVLVKNCCDPLSSPIRLISSTKPIPCLARIKLACLVNQRSQQVVDLSIFSLKVEVLRYEPFYVDKICR